MLGRTGFLRRMPKWRIFVFEHLTKTLKMGFSKTKDPRKGKLYPFCFAMAILKVVCYSAGCEQEASMIMLAADIGGTNSRFSIFSIEGGKPVYKCGVVISSKQEEFSHLLNRLFTCWPVEWTELARASLVVFAAAGPVRDGRIEMTNADFAVEEDQIRKHFRVPQPGEAYEVYSVADVLSVINLELKTTLSPTKVGMLLNKMGFKSIRTNKLRGYKVCRFSLEEISQNRKRTIAEGKEQALPF